MSEMEKLLKGIPRSYNDFVIGVTEFMDTDERKNAMLDYLRNNEGLSVSDVIKKLEEIEEEFPSDEDDEE